MVAQRAVYDSRGWLAQDFLEAGPSQASWWAALCPGTCLHQWLLIRVPIPSERQELSLSHPLIAVCTVLLFPGLIWVCLPLCTPAWPHLTFKKCMRRLLCRVCSMCLPKGDSTVLCGSSVLWCGWLYGRAMTFVNSCHPLRAQLCDKIHLCCP